MDRRLIKQIAETIRQADRHKTHAYDTAATVVRVEGGTAWVHIPGGVDETPVKLTVDAKQGDTVQVRVSGGRAFLVGNSTAPPTDNTLARTVQDGLTATRKVLTSVKKTAERAARIATSTAQYFWVSTGGNDNGAHVTAIPQEAFEADPQNGGGNTLMTTNGVAVRDGLVELAIFSQSGVEFGDRSGKHIKMYYSASNDEMRIYTDHVAVNEAQQTESADSFEHVKNTLIADTVTADGSESKSMGFVTCDAAHTSATLGGVESYHAQADLKAEAGGVSAGVQVEAVCDDVSDPTQNYSVIRLDGDMVRVNRQAALVKDTFSATGLSANTYYLTRTFNIAKTGYTQIALNVRTNQAAVVPASAQFDGSVTVSSRNSTISGLNLYLDVTYARNEFL